MTSGKSNKSLKMNVKILVFIYRVFHIKRLVWMSWTSTQTLGMRLY